MDAGKLDAYLTLTKMSDSDKEFVKAAQDKEVAWRRVQDNRLLNEAQQAIFETHEVLGTKGIFIPAELEREFKDSLDACSKGWAGEKATFDNRASEGTEKMILNF